jgi:holliday junction DNA helicase RuvA
MIEYLNGQLVEVNPAHVVLDVNGVGYFLQISINTYSALSGKGSAKLFIHEVIREDAHLLFAFFSVEERVLFRHLISVSGVGASTGILMLSSLSPSEIQGAIISEDVNCLKGIKGIGLKSAQRIIIELKDKLTKQPVSADIFATLNNTTREEALSALVTLGFLKKNAEKAIDHIMKLHPEKTVEQVIKDALKQM